MKLKCWEDWEQYHCPKCGAKCSRQEVVALYDIRSGREIYNLLLTCPNAGWFGVLSGHWKNHIKSIFD